MRLHNIIATPKAKARKRVGRGEGGGRGKTSGRGHKGQRSRAGHSLRPGFESGHVPLYRKLPKRGFNNAKFRVEYEVVNVGELARIEAAEIDRAALAAVNLAQRQTMPVKLLAVGEIDRPVTIHVDAASAAAKAKIEAAGGKVVLPAEAALEGEEADAPKTAPTPE